MGKKFKYLIVPCPGDPSFHGDEVIFSDLEDDKTEKGFKLYLGAKDRMRAAIIKVKDAKNVILVGGSQSKVVAMFIYFKKKICKLNPNYNSKLKIICLVSNSNSTGNISAVRKYFENHEKANFDVVIISNEYHLDRLKMVWESVFSELKLKPKLKTHKAEEILEESKKITTKNMYKKELERQKISQKKGCEDWKNRCYKNQDKIINWKPEFWMCQELKLEFKIEKER